MKKEYQTHILGLPAFEYIKRRLSYGHTLAQNVLKKVDLEAGEVTAALPEDSHLEGLYSFDEAILEPPANEEYQRYDKNGKKNNVVRKPIFYTYLVESVKTHLEADPRNICLIQDFNAQPNDAWVSHYNGATLTFEKEIYYPLIGANIADGNIEQSIRRGHSWTSIGIFTSSPQPEHVQDMRREVTLKELMVWAERTEHIYVGAYDFEAFLLWSKRSSQ